MQCPCGSQCEYDLCCGLFINGKATPPIPETLMRSRYVAYSLANIDYIKNTMRGKPLVGFDESSALCWAQRAIWIGLQIVNTVNKLDDVGYVEFIAKYIENNTLKFIHETSEFKRFNDKWFYVGGVLYPSTKTVVLRNALCPCGLNKKFKNCHAKRGE
jgi:SEC-C motif domain protein